MMTVIALMAINSICLAQLEKDTVCLYWPNEKLKYRSICCITDTIDSPDTSDPIFIANRKIEMWDENGNEIYFEDYLLTHTDIIELNTSPSIGQDELEYRELIKQADDAFNHIDVTNLKGLISVIELYVKAKEKIPEAIYPEQRLLDIQKLKKNYPQPHP